MLHLIASTVVASEGHLGIKWTTENYNQSTAAHLWMCVCVFNIIFYNINPILFPNSNFLMLSFP